MLQAAAPHVRQQWKSMIKDIPNGETKAAFTRGFQLASGSGFNPPLEVDSNLDY